jgi:hypothetical protein
MTQHTYHDYNPTHSNRPASVRVAKAKAEEAWQEYNAVCDEFEWLAERGVQADAHIYARLDCARRAALLADAEYSAIYRAAEHKAARESELQAEAEINTDEAEPVADFDDLPDQYELDAAAAAADERHDWLMQRYPQFN